MFRELANPSKIYLEEQRELGIELDYTLKDMHKKFITLV